MLEIISVPRYTILVPSYVLLYKVYIFINIIGVYRQNVFATN